MTSYENLANSRICLESVLVELGVELEAGAWIGRAYDLVEELAAIYANDARRHEFMERENKGGEVYFALYDVSSLYDILPFIRSENASTLKKKLKKILKMTPSSQETLENNEARNTLWELNFLARLKRANIQATLGDPNPDILALFNSRKYYIQCKRLYSPKEEALQRNIADAVCQLEKDLIGEQKNALGIVALSLERPLIEKNLMLVTESQQAGKDELSSVIKEIISQHGHLWQDPNLIKDQRIVAIILHLIVPGIIEKENTFVTGAQVIVNNTWADGSGFQSVIEDFGPLKKALEY